MHLQSKYLETLQQRMGRRNFCAANLQTDYEVSKSTYIT